MAVVKGTTPTFIFTTPIDLTEASKVWVTLSTMSECELITKSNEDLIITSESVSVFLSQTETLSLPKGQVKVQLNWLYQEGNKLKRACSKKKTISTDTNLLDKELTL